jgi:hypothetical protein
VGSCRFVNMPRGMLGPRPPRTLLCAGERPLPGFVKIRRADSPKNRNASTSLDAEALPAGRLMPIKQSNHSNNQTGDHKPPRTARA